MRVGVDTSVLVAAVHANHPNHKPASSWLDAAFTAHEVVIAHHSVLEAFAVLTRLPVKYRLSPSEAEMVLTETLRDNVSIASFGSGSTWKVLGWLTTVPVSGGASYDAFIIWLLQSADVEQIVTYNVHDFRRLAHGVRVSEPSEV